MDKPFLETTAPLPLWAPKSETSVFAIVDRVLLPSVSQAQWRLCTTTRGRPRAFTYAKTDMGTRKLYLERLVSNAARGRFVKFRNGNTLDCRTGNLEVVKERVEVFREDAVRKQRRALQRARLYGI